MIICTGCGKKNEDDVRYCEKCGKKLQSSRMVQTESNDPGGPLGQFRHKGIPTENRLSILRMVEAWGYVAVLGGVVAACAVYRVWWPLYPAVLVLGLLVWMRRI